MKKGICDFCENKAYLDNNNLCESCSDLLNNWVDLRSSNNGLFDEYIIKNKPKGNIKNIKNIKKECLF